MNKLFEKSHLSFNSFVKNYISRNTDISTRWKKVACVSDVNPILKTFKRDTELYKAILFRMSQEIDLSDAENIDQRTFGIYIKFIIVNVC